MIARIVARVRQGEFPRYFAVSVIALAVDMATVLLAVHWVHYLWAATAGFIAGAATSYVLAVRWAFQHRRLRQHPRQEFLAYAVVGVAGLGLNNLVIFAAVAALATPLAMAKSAAACATFAFNYGVRKRVLFSR